MSDLKSLLKDYISGEKKLPVKIRDKHWPEIDYETVLFITNNNCFVTVQENEFLRSLNGAFSVDDWEFYQEPKKKVKIAPYYFMENPGYTWILTDHLYIDDVEFISKNINIDKFIRCTALEIEVE